jgi:hypothetical protein
LVIVAYSSQGVHASAPCLRSHHVRLQRAGVESIAVHGFPLSPE